MRNTKKGGDKMTTSADMVFKMLSFQYAPLEKMLINGLKKEGNFELIKRYKGFPAARKIAILDKMANEFGL